LFAVATSGEVQPQKPSTKITLFIRFGLQERNLMNRVRVTAKLIEWADLILVMEKRHAQRLCQRFPQEMACKDYDVLDIPDDYGFMDPELIEMLEITIEPYMN